MEQPGQKPTGFFDTPSEREIIPANAYTHQESQNEPERSTIQSIPTAGSSTNRYEPVNIVDSSSSDSDDEKHQNLSRTAPHRIIEEADQIELRRVATTLSRRRSSYAGSHRTAEEFFDFSTEDPTLDPQHESFDLQRWIKAFMKEFDTQGVKPKRAGVLYKDLGVSGSGAALQLQDTVGSLVGAPLRPSTYLGFGRKDHKQILQNFDGIMKSGELLIVLGRPGSGCSTLLKTMCGELHGLKVDEQSTIHYNGITQKQMIKEFKGEALYNQEVDKHFPNLTVGQTLEFAASSRMPSHRIHDMPRNKLAQHVAQVVMAVFGLSHTYNTRVGNDFIRGVSGGERKRVSIAEMVVSGSPLAAWDNSTRGLDSASALKFVQSLRLASDLAGVANAVAIYQASQAIYDTFDKATVLYEGRQIYFGPANAAKAFFEKQGWSCPQRQTTGDFLTSVTNPQERKARDGMENKVPRTPEEFEQYWRQSSEYEALQTEIKQHEQEFPLDGSAAQQLREKKNFDQAKHVRPQSPYLISIPMQIRLNVKRAYQRIWNDISGTATANVIIIVQALIFGSIFYGAPDTAASFSSRGAVLFIAILSSALQSISEINSLYSQRPIVEKHASYAFYHPATEAIAGIFADIPVKFVSATLFNLILYFMSGLRREPAQFFLFFLITYISTFTMSAVFRTMAALTKTVAQAMSLAGILVLALVIYTGFLIPTPQMKVWFSWIRWINPVYYAFEILVANEFHGREFPCGTFVPAGLPLVGDSFICSTVGSVAGQTTVNGDVYIAANYGYYYSHVWRNFGILLGFLFFFMAIYFIAVELNSTTSSTAEVLVFQRGHVPAQLKGKTNQTKGDLEKAGSDTAIASEDDNNVKAIEPQRDIFTWKDVSYDIQIKGEPRRLLDNVSGWVKPGTLTALMGVSGAGKTTLLDVLAQRTSVGVVTGDMFVNGKPLDASFQRKTGYVQQQDLHLQTATVRESLRFSAMLRQPKYVSRQEKYEFVEEVIKMLNMQDFANAVVGVPGEGLNVEQRKLLTIGVELAAKPKLLLFLDEPTSGLDSQSSWAICAFLRKLADAGQAVLCTIHQPSAILFQEFDRLLFLAKGGKTVYLGDVGKNSQTLLEYFESSGARKCGKSENPAEYMLEIVNKGINDQGEDWHSVWKSSKERQAVEQEIERIHADKMNEPPNQDNHKSDQDQFAMPLTTQLQVVTARVFQQYWRMPSYIAAKLALAIVAGLFIGFTFFSADDTLAGSNLVIFSVFQITTIFSVIVNQIQPMFVTQRELYEVRERPSKAYSWKAFLVANIIVEIPWQILAGILTFAGFYYPVVGIQSSERQGLVLLFVIELFIYASSFAQMCIAAFPDAETAGGVVQLLTLMSIMFCGVLQAPNALPGFWIFMYRLSPFTYWIGGIVSTVLHDRSITCSAGETSIFNPPLGQTCGDYLASYLEMAPGQLQNPDAMEQCRYCSLSNADQFLAPLQIFWSERWRNFGIMWAFVFFNLIVAILSYYVFRVKKWGGISLKKAKKN